MQNLQILLVIEMDKKKIELKKKLNSYIQNLLFDNIFSIK